jgi:hypothetical protein
MLTTAGPTVGDAHDRLGVGVVQRLLLDVQ